MKRNEQDKPAFLVAYESLSHMLWFELLPLDEYDHALDAIIGEAIEYELEMGMVFPTSHQAVRKPKNRAKRAK